jgi:hypothetical protein
MDTALHYDNTDFYNVALEEVPVFDEPVPQFKHLDTRSNDTVEYGKGWSQLW